MTDSKRTTQDLRNILFDSIEKVKSGEMDARTAAQIANLAKVTIDTARLELDHSKVLSQLDRDDQNIVTCPLLLTED